MDSITLLRERLKAAHWVMEGTMADVTPEQMQWLPPGMANPVGATYAHAVTSEDAIVNGMLRQAAPMFATSWAGKTGSNIPMPMPGPEWENYGPWAHSVQVDLAAAREYAQAVYANTDEYLATLTPEALDAQIDLTGIGLGQQNLA